MRASELTSNPISISQSVDDGSLEGYVVNSDMPQLENYLTGQGASLELVEKIRNQYKRIAIFRNMYVEEEARGQGIGNDLISNAIDSAANNDAMAAILVSDTGESNAMDLTKWYEGFGFEIIGNAGEDPVMLLDLIS